MSVTQTQRAVGSWSLRLRGNVPQRILDALTYFGHVAIVPGQVTVAEYGDRLLTAARYVGVYRAKSMDTEGHNLSGAGMEMWLGDEEATGDVFETAVTLTDSTFAAAIVSLLPAGGAITSGTIHAVPGTYSGTHKWVTPRAAIDYVTEIFGATWRVNGNGTLDAGLESDLYVTDPRAIVMARDDARDLRYVPLPGKSSMDRDVADFTTRVVVLGEGEGDAVVVGSADNVSVPYNDIHGNPVVVKRIVSESQTTAANVDERAETILTQYAADRPRMSLSTSRYDVKGDVAVGDYIYVYNPSAEFEDFANEVPWEGEVIHPVKLQCIELSWPILPGWTVAFRDGDGVWTDLSPWVQFETGETTIVVGQLPRSLASSATPPGDRVNTDSSVPVAPAFSVISTGAYQSGETSTTKAALYLEWNTPLNSDGSVVLDGDHYEIRYRVNVGITFRVRWGSLDGQYRWGELSTSRWGAPLTEAVATDLEWQTQYVGWGTNQTTLIELTPGVAYELQIRAVDATPHNSPWSSSTSITTSGDSVAPSQPAAPTVAGSRIAIQVIHTLGKNSGGTYNLEPDLDHLDVHVSGNADFYPNVSNLVGSLSAGQANLMGHVAVVGTFSTDATEAVWVKVVAVDRSGNKSSPSVAATVTVELIDNAHISDLSVSKVTAGTISADWILGAKIKTDSDENQGAELQSEGLKMFNTDGELAIWLNALNGRIQVLESKLAAVYADGVTEAVQVGFTSEDRRGMLIKDLAGNPVMRVGEISTYPGYGAEVISPTGQVTSLGTMAFGIQAETIATYEGLDRDYNVTFVDLDTPGPILEDVYVGPSGRCLLFLSCEVDHQGVYSSNITDDDPFSTTEVSVEVTGATLISAFDFPVTLWASNMMQTVADDLGGTTDVGGYDLSLGQIVLLDTLNEGFHTFRMKYSADNALVSWANRTLVAIPY